MNYLTPEQAEHLLAEAAAAADKAYAPYSRYPVGAAVLAGDGRVFTGVNIENASFPAGTCAERVALGNAASRGLRDIAAIAVYSPHGDVSPCGFCRQFILEFGKDIVVVFRWKGKPEQKLISELLPYAFSGMK